MSRYFCLCPGGLKPDKCADVRVASFREIEQIINDFGDALPNKFTKLKTQHYMDKSPEQFPHWGKVYMVWGKTKEGHAVLLGCCNFEKKWHNYFSLHSVLLYFLLALSIAEIIRCLFFQELRISLWCFSFACMTCCLLMNRRLLIRQKTSYLLK